MSHLTLPRVDEPVRCCCGSMPLALNAMSDWLLLRTNKMHVSPVCHVTPAEYKSGVIMSQWIMPVLGR